MSDRMRRNVAGRGAEPAGRRTPGAVVRVAALVTLVAALLAACGGAPILANAPVVRPSPAATASPSAAPGDPRPLAFPRDDAPHDRLTEWWYYTGHLHDATGRHFGFEFVIFRAERGDFPTTWASHLALTDDAGNRFVYGQRSEIGPQVDLGSADGDAAGFDLAISGLDPSRSATVTGTPWTMRGAGGRDRLSATLSATEAVAQGQAAAFGLDLSLQSAAPPVLHDRIGWIDFGSAGSSYYYSRPTMAASGSIVLDGRSFSVDGTAWFDHQWGDFISVGGGGWDWFAVNLADGSALALSMVRDATGGYPLVYGTLVTADGTFRHLDAGDFAVTVTGRWTSPATGAEYPAGWRILVPSDRLDVTLTPSVAAQELDTRATTGVVYWEGSQRVTATRGGVPVEGNAYVELTGYGKP